MQDNDKNCEAYHNGYMAHKTGKPRPTEDQAAQGWDDRARDCKVVVVMPVRPEGYYHYPIGTFD